MSLFKSKKDFFLKLSLILVLLIQIVFWSKTSHIKPDMIIVPEPPKTVVAKLLSLGDTQFYFRYLTFRLQTAGDSWGRFTALKDYNYKKLADWFYLLDEFDAKSNFVPSIASYYYSQTQNPQDTIYIVEYLEQHALRDIRKKWWWLAQAVYIANHKLEDKRLALRLAYELKNAPLDIAMPLWARQMPAFIHEKLGEYAAAKEIIADILQNNEQFTEGELNFMEHFLSERLKNPKFLNEVKDLIVKRRANTISDKSLRGK